MMQRVCDKHDAAYYPRFKQWADEYFYCKHRDQRRGLGGIFFDDLNDRPQDEVCTLSVRPSAVHVATFHAFSTLHGGTTCFRMPDGAQWDRCIKAGGDQRDLTISCLLCGILLIPKVEG